MSEPTHLLHRQPIREKRPHHAPPPPAEPINTFHGIHQNNDEPIRVSYHRNIHYNSVVNPNKATIGVGLGLPAFKPGVTEPEPVRPEHTHNSSLYNDL